MNNICAICNQTIQIMCRKGTGICSELCEKGADKIREDNVQVFKEEQVRAIEILEKRAS